ncbi:MAG: hypothetical protein KA444_05995 [Bacteroidia bacterium]|nr:hypothetical protein [Bacteroidia bacterium]
MRRFFQLLDSFFLRMEKSLGLLATSILVGLFLIGIAALLSSPRWELFYHGKGFSRLSLAPFDFSQESSLRFRILSPLLGYVLFLKGPLFKYLMLAILGFFYSLLYYFHRRKKHRPSESFGIGMVLALSTLAFFQLYFPGYNDPLSYVLILVALFNRERRVLLMTCLALMLFNHDNTIFLFPFFFLFLLEEDYSLKNLYSKIIFFLPAIALYAAYRLIISSISDPGFDTSYYFNRENLRWTWDHVSEHLWYGIFQAFRSGWIFPLIAIVINVKEKRYKEILLLIVGFIFIISQMFIAFDISRLVGLAFPVLLLSAWRTGKYVGEENFLKILWAVVFLNLFIPSEIVGALEPIPIPPFWIGL